MCFASDERDVEVVEVAVTRAHLGLPKAVEEGKEWSDDDDDDVFASLSLSLSLSLCLLQKIKFTSTYNN